MQLDDNKINSLKYNLLNKSKEADTNILLGKKNLTNLLSDNINFNNNINLTNSQINSNNNSNSPPTDKISNVELENLYLKAFILNKLNSILGNTNVNEKLILYNLISNANKNNQNTYQDNLCSNNNLFGIMNNNNNFNNGIQSIEKHFQKEVVKFTIENFCTYLKSNGFIIVKKSNDENISTSSKRKKNTQMFNDNSENILNDNLSECSQKEEKNSFDKKFLNKKSASTLREEKSKKSWLCPHVDKAHYARGKCRNCYLNSYHKVNFNN